MKQLIALCASLILLLTFPLQYALEQRNHYRISQLHLFVNNAKEKARFEGFFSEDIIDELITNISNTFNIDKSEVVVDATTVPRYRTNEFNEHELIYYRVEVPIKKIIAANVFWGISDIDNKQMYVIDNHCSSELLLP